MIGGWIFGYFDLFSFKHHVTNSEIIRLNKTNEYKYINPLLLCGISENKEFTEFAPLKNEINDIVNKQLSDNKAQKISVYYRVLNSGRWFGINENEKYSPASLLKVPLMIAYLKSAENDQSVLTKKIYYDGSFDNNVKEYFKPKVRIEPNNEYTVDQLLEGAIVYSGNNAEQLLVKNMDLKTLADIFTDLDVPFPQEATLDYMSAKSYSYFFRVLYNSSYLNRKMSEKALELLSKARFEYGISKGVPENIPVAQKFGERTVLSQDRKNIYWRELHDCGIVYTTNDPYLLCVMTKGQSFDDLSETIISISKKIFEYNTKPHA